VGPALHPAPRRRGFHERPLQQAAGRGLRPLLRGALAGALIAASAAIPLSGSAAGPVEIHAILATTGAFAFNGEQSVRSLAVAEDTVNKAGGIGGRPIKFVIHDDQTNPGVAVQIANTLLAQNVQVILGPSPVAACSAVAPIVKTKMVLFCMSAAFHPPANSNFYVAGISTTAQIVFAVRYLRQRGIRRLASMTSVDENGADCDNAIRTALSLPENKDITLVSAEHFALNDISVDAQMARIKGSGAQVVITGNNGTPLGVLLHGYTDLGLEIPLVTTSAALNSSARTQFASILPKEFLVTGSLSDGPDVVPNGPQKAGIRSYINAFKLAGIDPDHSHSVIWDPAMVVITALRKVGPDASAEQIDRFIHNLHAWPGASGLYDFRSGSQSGLDPTSLIMVRWNAERSAWQAVSKPGGAPLGSK
jgi:branched-chain amino acid transport system substrate-binding protein